MLQWRAEKIRLELKYSWTLSRNTSDFKENIIIYCSDGEYGGMGECAPNIRYGETPAGVLEQFSVIRENIQEADPELFHRQYALKGINHSLKFALESAYLQYFAHKNSTTVSQLLGLPAPGPRFTTYSIPIMPAGQIEAFGRQNNLSEFHILKVKIGKDDALDMIRTVEALYDKPLIIDANEAWNNPDELMVFLEKLDRSRVLFIEQPFPAGKTEEYEYLKSQSPFPVWADESIIDKGDFYALAKQFDGINVKLMKTGSYYTAIELLNQARDHRMGTMLGCMVETTLGIVSAMQLESLADHIDLDGFLMVKNEPFGMVSLNSNGQLSVAE